MPDGIAECLVAHASCVLASAFSIANFAAGSIALLKGKLVSARHRNQHAGRVRYPGTAFRLRSNARLLETAQTKTPPDAAVPERMADADSARCSIFPQIIGERPRGTTWSHSGFSCRETL